MKEEIKLIEQNLLEEIKLINDLEGIKQIKAKYLSKSPFLSELKKQISTSDNKAELGKTINEYSNLIGGIINSKKEELENSFDIEERPNPITNNNSIELKEKTAVEHPLSRVANIVHNFFNELNFEHEKGIEVETEEYNFDRLNLPSDHPARTMQDTFYLENNKLLRTHATNMTSRTLEKTNKEEYASYSIGTVFRNDENDATHSFQFHQIDIFQIGSDISVANLKWVIDSLLERLFGNELDIRYRPSYFPFTEPSFEVDIKRKNDTNWIEILGCGMIHRNVIKLSGKDPEKIQGYAAGIGLERVAMLKYGIEDIREFTNNDLEFLKGVK